MNYISNESALLCSLFSAVIGAVWNEFALRERLPSFNISIGFGDHIKAFWNSTSVLCTLIKATSTLIAIYVVALGIAIGVWWGIAYLTLKLVGIGIGT